MTEYKETCDHCGANWETEGNLYSCGDCGVMICAECDNDGYCGACYDEMWGDDE
jgi:hypothetical protein